MYLALVEVLAQPIPQIIEMKFPAFGDARRWALRQAGSLDGFTGHAAVFQVNGPLVVLAWELRDAAPPRADAHAPETADYTVAPQRAADCADDADQPACESDACDPWQEAGTGFAEPRFAVRGLFAHDPR